MSEVGPAAETLLEPAQCVVLNPTYERCRLGHVRWGILMMVREVVLAITLVFATAAAADAQSADILPREADVLADKFFRDLKGGDVNGAFHSAFKDTEAIVGTATLDNTSAQVGALLKGFGAIEDWKPFKTTVLSPSFARMVYLMRCDKVPVFWAVQFYNPGAYWRIIDVQVGTYNQARALGILDGTELYPPEKPAENARSAAASFAGTSADLAVDSLGFVDEVPDPQTG